ncbi:MAG: hypothetical protein Q4B86_04030 [Eubacteriales bacterium]|nr:hypothetical protein [Eubacteriales bacterium]
MLGRVLSFTEDMFVHVKVYTSWNRYKNSLVKGGVVPKNVYTSVDRYKKLPEAQAFVPKRPPVEEKGTNCLLPELCLYL